MILLKFGIIQKFGETFWRLNKRKVCKSVILQKITSIFVFFRFRATFSTSNIITVQIELEFKKSEVRKF